MTIGKIKKAGLREPEFIGGEVDLRINIYRGQVNDTNATNSAPNGINGTEKMPDNAEKVPDSEQEQLVYKYVLDNGNKVPDTGKKCRIAVRKCRIVNRNDSFMSMF